MRSNLSCIFSVYADEDPMSHEPSRAQERRIQKVRPVRRADDKNIGRTSGGHAI
jgi:hypothetical protein